MRYVVLVAACAVCVAAEPVFAFDVQNGGGQAAGSMNLQSDPASTPVPGVSLDQDLRAQLGLADDAKAKAADTNKSGFQFSTGPFGASANVNQSSLGYYDSPWVAPRQRPGRD